MPERANPETCLHNVIQQFLEPPVAGFICVSCDSTLDPSFYANKQYDYDIDYNVWVYIRTRG